MYCKIDILGNIGRVELKELSDKEFLSISVATSENYKKNDKWETETTWHDVTIWNPTEYVKSNTAVGKKIFISGTLKKREYEKDGVKRIHTGINAKKVILLDTDRPGTKNDDMPF